VATRHTQVCQRMLPRRAKGRLHPSLDGALLAPVAGLVKQPAQGLITEQLAPACGREEVPSSVPKLHMGSADNRLHLIGDGKHMSETSPASAEVTRGMRSGGRSSCPMIMKPRAKEVRCCEDQVCQRNQQMAG
jgi:hypothetical protein